MKDLKHTIRFRLRVQWVLHILIVLLIAGSYLVVSTAAFDTTTKAVLMGVLGIGVVGSLLTAALHYFSLDDYKMAEAIMESSTEGVIVTDKHNKIVFVNDQFLKTNQTDYDFVIGKDPGFFKSGIHDATFYKSMWKAIQNDGHWQGEIWDRKHNGNGSLYLKTLAIRTIGRYKRTPRFYTGVFRDQTSYKKLQNRYSFEQYYFTPTALPNEKLVEDIMRTKIESAQPFQLHYIRIVNYSYLISAHTPEGFYGALKQIKERLDAFKETVTFGQIDRETLLLIKEGPYEENAFRQWIAKLNATLEEPVASLMKFDVRVGVSLYPKHGDTPDILLTKATLAFDYTDQRGKLNHAVYDPKYHQAINDEYGMRDAIIEGLKKSEFSLVYHPICSKGSSNKMLGVEALLRWDSKIYGKVSPDIFVPIAEKFYLMNRLGTFVMEEALKQKNKLDQTFGKGIVMSINTSATQYESPYMINTLEKCIKKRDIAPSEIIIEITESSIMANMDQSILYLAKIRDLGVRIALDDFGTGFSSLSYLKSMPLHFVKIDRAFIRGYPEKDDGTLARTIIRIGTDLNLEVIAEGIETEAQAKMLEDNGCHFFQGYYYARPLKFDVLLEFIRNYCKEA